MSAPWLATPTMSKHGWYALLGVVALLATIALLLRHPHVPPHSVTLTWNAPAARRGATAVGYNVYRRTAESNSFTRIAEKVSGSPYEDRLVTGGRKYFYAVTSIDQLGRESRFSAEAAAEIPPDH